MIAIMAVAACGCMKPKEEGLRAQDLDVNLAVKRHNEYYVVCEATFADLASPGTPIVLEDDAVLTCNGAPMVKDPVGYYLFVDYRPGLKVTLSVFRPINGSSYAVTEAF